jgi:hypothetical protein
MQKFDIKKEYKTYYSTPKTPELISVPSIKCLSIIGRGEPAGEEFNRKIEAIYALAYGIKKLSKGEGKDFSIPPMGGLWWIDGVKSVLEASPEEWCWKLIIHLPDFIKADLVKKAKEEVSQKKRLDLILDVVFERFSEGKSLQILHIGPYTTEQATVEKIRQAMSSQKFKQNGHHHEIYLSDPRKVSPEKLKTIIRYPVASN